MGEQRPANKGHFWLGLSVGLLLGIILAISFYFLDKYTSLEMLRFQHENTEAAFPESVPDSAPAHTAAPKTASAKDTARHLLAACPPADSTDTESDDYMEFDNDDLMMDLDDDKVKTVTKAKGIASRRVRVLNYCSVAGVEPEYEYFDVEQWSEPVKNRISYQRKGNILKIRGIDINSIEIGWMPEGYILRTNGWSENSHAYAIPENQEFTRLTD